MNSEFEARQVEAWLAHTVAAVDAYPVPDEARGEAPVPVAGGLDFAVDVGLQLRGAGNANFPQATGANAFSFYHSAAAKCVTKNYN